MDDRDDAFRISMGGKEIPVYQGITKRKHIDYFRLDTDIYEINNDEIRIKQIV